MNEQLAEILASLAEAIKAGRKVRITADEVKIDADEFTASALDFTIE